MRIMIYIFETVNTDFEIYGIKPLLGFYNGAQHWKIKAKIKYFKQSF